LPRNKWVNGVVALSANVTEFKPGDRVMAFRLCVRPEEALFVYMVNMPFMEAKKMTSLRRQGLLESKHISASRSLSSADFCLHTAIILK
jgi:NADPH:quinone reductase-like Zn-dependent oxidoreductase